MSSDTALRDQRPSTADRQTALREFLRSRRARVKPEDVTNSSASARFLVYGDGKLLADSGVKTASQGPSTLDVTTTGYATLELRVTDARNGTSYDHADWEEPQLPAADSGRLRIVEFDSKAVSGNAGAGCSH